MNINWLQLQLSTRFFIYASPKIHSPAISTPVSIIFVNIFLPVSHVNYFSEWTLYFSYPNTGGGLFYYKHNAALKHYIKYESMCGVGLLLLALYIFLKLQSSNLHTFNVTSQIMELS